MVPSTSHVRVARIALATAALAASCLAAQTSSAFEEDFDVVVRRIAETYAYFDTKATRWKDVPALYAGDLRSLKSREEFVALLERVLDELYDPHAHLTTNLERSFRLVPSGADLWAEWQRGEATITQVRDTSDASRAGLRPGTVVVAIDGIPIGDAVDARMGRAYDHSVAAARDWALRTMLAGRHNTPRRLRVRDKGATRPVELPAADQVTGRGAPLQAPEIRPGIGYVRFNDSLGDWSFSAA